eukprot:169701_1
MASGAPTDDAPDATGLITITVHINRQYESKNNLDTKQDICKSAELERESIKLSDLKTNILIAFGNSTSFKSVFKNDDYDWKIFSYDPTKAYIEITNDDDLEEEVANFNPSYDDEDTQDNNEDDDIVDNDKFLKLRIVFFKRNLDDEKSQVTSQKIIDKPQQKKDPTITIQKGEIISPYIEAIYIDHDTLSIRLSLHEPVTTKTIFYIYECGSEDGDKLAKITLKKNQIETTKDIDLDEIDGKSLKIATYKKLHDTKPISNTLQITIPVKDQAMNYKPNPISLSTVKAIEVDDEKNENIYIYFDLPSDIQGEDIEFTIKYVGDDNKEVESISLPLMISKASIPKSFTITTRVTIDDKEYLSQPSDVITVDYKKQLISFMIDYIYNNDTVKIEFDKKKCTDFNIFKQIINDELKIDETDINALKIGHKGNDNKLRPITDRDLNRTLSLAETSGVAV